jgi:hypothetical protein
MGEMREQSSSWFLKFQTHFLSDRGDGYGGSLEHWIQLCALVQCTDNVRIGQTPSTLFLQSLSSVRSSISGVVNAGWSADGWAACSIFWIPKTIQILKTRTHLISVKLRHSVGLTARVLVPTEHLAWRGKVPSTEPFELMLVRNFHMYQKLWR